jgi:hypothetical protein
VSRKGKELRIWERPLQDGDDMLKESLKDGNGYGCTLNAAGTGILLQLDDATDGMQVRVRLDREEADYLAHTLNRLVACLPTEKQEVQP